MKVLTVNFALLCQAALTYAAPGSSQKPRQFDASITFIGAGPGPPFYFQAFPTDDTVHKISKHLIHPHFSTTLRPSPDLKQYSVLAILFKDSYEM